MEQYLCSTPYFDFDHPKVKEYAEALVGSESDPTQIAIRLYLGVRDDIRYNPYTFKVDSKTFSASYCLEARESYCIPKAVLYGALCRLYGIPSRIGLADVKNHLASPQFLEYLQSDVFAMHGYTEIFLNGKWVKATPAFDQGLCGLMNVSPLEFDGENDSIFHEFDNNGERHMEYLAEHGIFDDVPHQRILQGIAEAYPHLADTSFEKAANKSIYKDMQVD